MSWTRWMPPSLLSNHPMMTPKPSSPPNAPTAAIALATANAMRRRFLRDESVSRGPTASCPCCLLAPTMARLSNLFHAPKRVRHEPDPDLTLQPGVVPAPAARRRLPSPVRHGTRPQPRVVTQIDRPG